MLAADLFQQSARTGQLLTSHRPEPRQSSEPISASCWHRAYKATRCSHSLALNLPMRRERRCRRRDFLLSSRHMPAPLPFCEVPPLTLTTPVHRIARWASSVHFLTLVTSASCSGDIRAVGNLSLSSTTPYPGNAFKEDGGGKRAELHQKSSFPWKTGHCLPSLVLPLLTTSWERISASSQTRKS